MSGLLYLPATARPHCGEPPTSSIAGVCKGFSNIRASLRERCGARAGMRGPMAASAPHTHAVEGSRRTRSRIGMHHATSARTAMSHGDSAAAHHICASMHSNESRAARRKEGSDGRRALCGGAFGAIRADMARRLR
ncbi:hypothetical protein [Burkholderia ambifaria]|uniref:hypothetical protein n=1 Tax=Burkholderia ambifaria TaxID=152480 RepID=UPI001FC7CB8E|nr:hypothetical protein [Burkholderia ambifaria]